jgi:hypothetical protein
LLERDKIEELPGEIEGRQGRNKKVAIYFGFSDGWGV